MTAPAFGATDILSLGSDWEPQGSDGTLNKTLAEAAGGNGDIVAENSYAAVESGTARYIYVGAETGMIAAIVAANALPGQLVATDTLMITGVAVDYSPCAAGKRPLVTFSFRDGPTAAPATPYWYTSNVTLPTYASANIAVPTVLTVTAGDAECVNCQWSLACQLGQDLDKDGAFLDGDAYGGRETLTLTTVGTFTSVTSTGWEQTQGPSTKAASTSNTDYPQFTYSYTRKVARSTGA